MRFLRQNRHLRQNCRLREDSWVPHVALAMAWAIVLSALGPGTAWAQCTKEEFAAVVDQSGQMLRTLNEKNKAPFQTKLRELKAKKGWTDQQFLVEARPFVIDDKIKSFDDDASGLVQEINTLGDTTAAPAPDCKTLEGLRANLDKLVAVVTAKWLYMTEKIDAALK
jgi:hypothetical protein